MLRTEYSIKPNYSMLSNYNGTVRNTLGIGSVAPINLGERMIGVQAVPMFAGAFYGPMKNYDSLVHNPVTAFGGYATVSDGYTDCDANPNSKYCAMNGGSCVNYAMRGCSDGNIMRGPTGPTGGNMRQ
jgi:hypothetical protein